MPFSGGTGFLLLRKINIKNIQSLQSFVGAGLALPLRCGEEDIPLHPASAYRAAPPCGVFSLVRHLGRRSPDVSGAGGVVRQAQETIPVANVQHVAACFGAV